MKTSGNHHEILVVLLALTSSILLSCTPTTESGPTDIQAAPATDNEAETAGPPPLVVDTSAPLLLDKPTEAEDASAVAATRAAAENAACFVCHANYKTEFLVDSHAKADIGCVHCHGQSSAHRNDENNTTPPEIMYPAEKIDPFCRGCHTAHDIPPRTIIARWLKRSEKEANPSCCGCHEEDDVPPEQVVVRWKERSLDKNETDPGNIICTDCHGDHRMKLRTVIWDKASGRLLRTNTGD